ncbi:MAG: flagellar biosynthesis anti-sigma factor FlgM [Planctomycetota bacterium]
MQIFGPFRVSTPQAAGNVSGAQRANPSQSTKPTDAAKPKSAAPVDELDLSSSVTGTNRLAGTTSASDGEIRVDRVAEIRRQIASGTYETPDKLDAALDRLLDELA